MALEETNGNGFYMPVAPAYNGGYNNGFGGFGGDGWWIILLFVLLGGGGMWGGMGGMNGLYPWLNNSENINGGFRSQALNESVGGIRDAITNGFATAEASANARQIADMQQNFALQSQFANCCCENRLAVANLGADIAREACADRAAVSDGIRDVLTATTAQTQRILDKLCDQELAAERRENANLRQELIFARGQASQVAQTAELRQANATNLNNLVSELRSCPIPAQPVYGTTPIFTCGGSCGCSGNTFMN